MKGLRNTTSNQTNNDTVPDNIWSRCILHLDIDCFYCQCEEIDRSLRDNPRPLAIGQKHIIVTCNYEARSYGVKKLQLRESAIAACPHLLIVEGSDLLRYKRYSRKVYEAFRLALSEIASETSALIPAKKGCMDEMMADISNAVQSMLEAGDIPEDANDLTSNSEADKHYQSTFVFGDSDAQIKLVEDQTGQTTTVTSSDRNGGKHFQSTKFPNRLLRPSRRNVHNHYGNKMDQQLCIQRLHLAGKLASRVCRRIVQETGLFTTGGISVSPLLAKLASDLKKPKSINLLYPWRSSPILYAMPLRKLHSVGSRTMKALDQCVTKVKSDTQAKDAVKTVFDLLRVPQASIAKSLQGLQAYHNSGYVIMKHLRTYRTAPNRIGPVPLFAHIDVPT